METVPSKHTCPHAIGTLWVVWELGVVTSGTASTVGGINAHTNAQRSTMSVTFTSSRPATCLGHTVSCYAYGPEANWRGIISATPEEAELVHSVDHVGNLDCDGNIGGQHVERVYDTDTDPSVNMSNTNAAHLLGLLGLIDEDGPFMSGFVSTEDMRGRILLARALAPSDAGVPATVVKNDNGPTIYDGGRPEGYAEKRLAQLDDIVDFALQHQADISWG